MSRNGRNPVRAPYVYMNQIETSFGRDVLSGKLSFCCLAYRQIEQKLLSSKVTTE